MTGGLSQQVSAHMMKRTWASHRLEWLMLEMPVFTQLCGAILPFILDVSRMHQDKVFYFYKSLISSYSEAAEDRVLPRIRPSLCCSAVPQFSFHNGYWEWAAQKIQQAPRHLTNLSCCNSKGLWTAPQIPTAWCNTCTYTETVKSYFPYEAANIPAYLQWVLSLLCCFYIIWLYNYYGNPEQSLLMVKV